MEMDKYSTVLADLSPTHVLYITHQKEKNGTITLYLRSILTRICSMVIGVLTLPIYPRPYLHITVAHIFPPVSQFFFLYKLGVRMLISERYQDQREFFFFSLSILLNSIFFSLSRIASAAASANRIFFNFPAPLPFLFILKPPSPKVVVVVVATSTLIPFHFSPHLSLVCIY